LYDANTVYVALDNHKYGDFKPYLVKSTDAGLSWTSISGNIPENHLVWRVIQDHEKSNLLFAATEFGIFFTLDGGSKWMKLKGSPTIPFRDITIQRRENDLVGASFGRGFFVLDNYSVLRDVTEDGLESPGKIYAVKDADWYVPRNIASPQGTGKFVGNNPPFGATFSYSLGESLSTMAGARKKEEGKLKKDGKDVPFPGWEALDAEKDEEKPKVVLTIKDEDGTVVQRLNGSTSKGLHRTSWNLRKMGKSGIRLQQQSGGGGFRRGSRGAMVTPGTYTVTLSKQVNGEVTVLDGPVPFELVPLRKGTLKGASYEEIIAFTSELEDLQSAMSAFNFKLDHCQKKIGAMNTAVSRLDKDAPGMISDLYQLKKQLIAFDRKVNGSDAKSEIGERNNPSVQSRMFVGFRGLSTTYGPTEMHKESLRIATTEFEGLRSELESIESGDLKRIEEKLSEMGAPWIEGQAIPKNY
ncbi:MAG: glycosyl hydrolase, partial [Saprospiraceae bacterium]|nr:glycosyl hydrolase [Saprospiraceae bacterium]